MVLHNFETLSCEMLDYNHFAKIFNEIYILALENVTNGIETFVRYLQTMTTAIAQSMCHLASWVYDSLRAYKLPLTGTKLFLTGLKSRILWQ